MQISARLALPGAGPALPWVWPWVLLCASRIRKIWVQSDSKPALPCLPCPGYGPGSCSAVLRFVRISLPCTALPCLALPWVCSGFWDMGELASNSQDSDLGATGFELGRLNDCECVRNRLYGIKYTENIKQIRHTTSEPLPCGPATYLKHLTVRTRAFLLYFLVFPFFHSSLPLIAGSLSYLSRLSFLLCLLVPCFPSVVCIAFHFSFVSFLPSSVRNVPCCFFPPSIPWFLSSFCLTLYFLLFVSWALSVFLVVFLSSCFISCTFLSLLPLWNPLMSWFPFLLYF